MLDFKGYYGGFFLQYLDVVEYYVNNFDQKIV